MSSNYVLDDLKYVVERLRDPKTGCPWDTQQNFESLQDYLLEEVYEVIDSNKFNVRPNTCL